MSGGIEYSRDFKDYEIGVSGVGRVHAGFVDPFASLGIGSANFKLNSSSDNSIFYTGSLGVQFNPVPIVKPFIEYRLTGCNFKRFSSQNYKPDNSVGRWIFGIYITL